MKTHTQTILAAAALFYALTANAQTVTSFGSPDCGQWVKLQRPADRAWLLGYLSGMNHLWASLARLNKNMPPAGMDPLDALSSADQAYVWMDNYCQKNPLKRVSDGGNDLFFELMAKK